MIDRTGPSHPVTAALAPEPSADPISEIILAMRFSNEFGFCDLNEFPGCSQLVVSNHAFIYPEHRGKGHGSANHERRLERIKDLGYDAAICTVRSTNEPQIKIMEKHGWELIWNFYSRVTQCTIHVYAKRIVTC